YAPGADSGTFDYFTEAINGDNGVHRSDNTTFSEDDNVLVQGVSADRGGIGYFGFSYYANNAGALKAVPVVNDAGMPIIPSNATINDGSYNPLSRPLFIYVSVASLQRDEVAAFVEYYLTDGTWLVDTPEVGYVQLPQEIYAAILSRVQNTVAGSAIADALEGATLAQIYGAEPTTMLMDLSDLEGAIAVDGSSTVFPITEAMAEEFGILTDRGVRVTVGVSGTGGGFKRFCAGETDISDASRPIKDSEVELCADAGIDFVEVPVAFDGLTVVINPDNDWVDFLTVEEINHIFRPDDFATSWAEVRDGFPDIEISLYAPGADSGTFDYFTEAINGDNGVHRSDNTTFSEDDNVLVQGVSNDRGGIGYFGFSYYANNADVLKAVPIINDAGDPVTPSNGTINDGSYNPLSRPLFIYVSVASLERAEVAAFVEYFLTDGTWLVETPEVGYVQLPQQIYASVLSRVQHTVTGSAMATAEEGQSLGDIFGHLLGTEG
ncbi:MAG: phosphate ABC transporter substrate-binding protein PstS family protein, partial [Chloroflexi bacterium]|nr:phosphate ABC transporter substrate-binding protein PstS family protein [Chloroflexota bacterium]